MLANEEDSSRKRFIVSLAPAPHLTPTPHLTPCLSSWCQLVWNSRSWLTFIWTLRISKLNKALLSVVVRTCLTLQLRSDEIQAIMFCDEKLILYFMWKIARALNSVQTIFFSLEEYPIMNYDGAGVLVWCVEQPVRPVLMNIRWVSVTFVVWCQHYPPQSRLPRPSRPSSSFLVFDWCYDTIFVYVIKIHVCLKLVM